MKTKLSKGSIKNAWKPMHIKNVPSEEFELFFSDLLGYYYH